MSKVHVRNENDFTKIVLELPIPEESVKNLARELDKCKGKILNNEFMIWQPNGNHALELIFEKPPAPLPQPLGQPASPTTPPQPEKTSMPKSEKPPPKKKHGA